LSVCGFEVFNTAIPNQAQSNCLKIRVIGKFGVNNLLMVGLIYSILLITFTALPLGGNADARQADHLNTKLSK